MNNEQTQVQIRTRMKLFDDVFHCVIIALERLEGYLLVGKSTGELISTGIKTDRDLHDDVRNPQSRKLLYSEMELQCQTLFYQTKFDDEELFHTTVSYFLKDLLMWYGGRPKNGAYDDVDKFFIPIASALDRHVHDARQIGQTVIKYVTDIDHTIENMDDDAKEKAVREGFIAWLKAQGIVEERMQAFLESGKEVELTVHKRGSIQEGLERLYHAFILLYDDSTPVLFLENLRKKYLPKIEFDTTGILMNAIASLKQHYGTGQERH